MCSVIRFPTQAVMGTNVTTHFWQLLLRLRGFIIGSLSFSSLYSHLQKCWFPFFLIAHHTIFAKRCSIRWFNNYSWKSLLRELRSSVLKHQQCEWYCIGHSRFRASQRALLLPQNLIWNTNVLLTAKLSLEHKTPHLGDVQLCDVILSYIYQATFV